MSHFEARARIFGQFDRKTVPNYLRIGDCDSIHIVYFIKLHQLIRFEETNSPSYDIDV